jgi:hypothetical protein
MKERIYNLFLFIEGEFIRGLGIAVHDVDGTDDEKMSYLRVHAETDLKEALRFPVPGRYLVFDSSESIQATALRYTLYTRLRHSGRQYELFDEALEELGAPQSLVSCITPIVDGKIQIDRVVPFDAPPTDSQETDDVWIHYPVPDYLEEYATDSGIDLPRLLHDDAFSAIKLLFNHRHYVSASKLIVSFIDTVAFLEFGDKAGNFDEWLDTYADLTGLGITSSELWEFRNSLLHTLTLDSRKVLSGKIRRVMFYTGTWPTGVPTEDDEGKLFALRDLIVVIANALERWFESFNVDRLKFRVFLERYDRIVSEARSGSLIVEKPPCRPRNG